MACLARNDLGYGVMNRYYTKRLMGKDIEPKEIDAFDLEMLEEELAKFEIRRGIKKKTKEFDRDFFVPELLGDNIREHFEEMANDLISPYLKIVKKILRADFDELPEFNQDFADLLVQAAVPHTEKTPWLKIWVEDGELDFDYLETPDSNWLVFDTETFVKGSRTNMPIIGVAAGMDISRTMCYYLWTHEVILNPTLTYEPALAPIGTDKVVICHNVAFDAAKVKERYTLDPLNNFYLCTQAMHQAANGLDSSQRWAVGAKDLDFPPRFLKVGCGNSLVAAYQFHTGKTLPSDAKDPRKLFVTAEHAQEFNDRLEDCLNYAFHDVYYTLELFQNLWKPYRKSCPSNVVLAGHAYLANSTLPVRNDWYDWCEKVDKAWKDSNQEINNLLNQVADEYHQAWQDGELDPENDPWLKNLNWDRASKNEFSPLYYTAKWYADKVIYDKPLDIGGKSDTAIYLLRLCWKGVPLQKSKENGWHWLDPESGDPVKVPHKKGDGSNVGSVLTPTYIPFFDDGTLHSADGNESASEKAKQICKLISLTSYWTGMRNRVLAVHAERYENPEDGSMMTLVAPNVNPHGTSSGK